MAKTKEIFHFLEIIVPDFFFDKAYNIVLVGNEPKESRQMKKIKKLNFAYLNRLSENRLKYIFDRLSEYEVNMVFNNLDDDEKVTIAIKINASITFHEANNNSSNTEQKGVHISFFVGCDTVEKVNARYKSISPRFRHRA
jgi:hypothetical protein